MEHKNILCCIFNYNHSENAIKWAESLKGDFAVSILDTYVLDNPGEKKDPLEDYDGNVLFYHNIFLGGLTIESFKICIGGDFKFLCIINSDVIIDEENLLKLKSRLSTLPDDIGIYEISATPDSCVMGVIGKMAYTEKYFIHSEEEFKEDGLGEGWLYGIKADCIKHLLPFLSIDKNKHGWGIGGALLAISKNKGYRNVIDSKVFAYHPKGTGYNMSEAKYEWYEFDKIFEKIGIPQAYITIGFCSKKHNEGYIKYLESYFSNAMLIVEKVCDTDNISEVLRSYNEIIEESIPDGVLLLPENTYFIPQHKDGDAYINTIQEIFFKNKEYGILGCAAKYIYNENIITRSRPAQFLFHEAGDNGFYRYEGGTGKAYSTEVFEDAIVDGRFLAIRKDRIKKLFNVDSALPYDAEFCISNYLLGVKIGVTKAFSLIFKNKNEIDVQQTANLLKQYEKELPIKI